MLYHKGNMMRDPIWFKEFEREYNEREDRIAELKEKHKPSKKEWVGLTDEEYEAMAEDHVTDCYFDTLTYAKAIEAKLKEKNT